MYLAFWSGNHLFPQQRYYRHSVQAQSLWQSSVPYYTESVEVHFVTFAVEQEPKVNPATPAARPAGALLVAQSLRRVHTRRLPRGQIGGQQRGSVGEQHNDADLQPGDDHMQPLIALGEEGNQLAR